MYDDAAFLLRPWMQRPFERDGATSAEKSVNRDMSAVQMAVQHNYKDLKQYWTHNDFARNRKVSKIPVALLCKVSAILLTFRACLYKGGQTNHSFKFFPPALEEYLSFT